MNNRINSFFAVILIALAVTVFFTPGKCLAAPRQEQSTAIPEDKRPAPAGAWAVGIILSAGAVVVGLKNSKRTHLD